MKAVLAFLLVAVACMVHVAFARVQWLGAKDAEAYDPVTGKVIYIYLTHLFLSCASRFFSMCILISQCITGNKVSDMSHQLSFKISSQILFFEGDYSMKV